MVLFPTKLQLSQMIMNSSGNLLVDLQWEISRSLVLQKQTSVLVTQPLEIFQFLELVEEEQTQFGKHSQKLLFLVSEKKKLEKHLLVQELFTILFLQKIPDHMIIKELVISMQFLEQQILSDSIHQILQLQLISLVKVLTDLLLTGMAKDRRYYLVN